MPDPAAYARMSLAERGAVCSALSVLDLHTFAAQYAAFLDTHLPDATIRTDPAHVFAQMCAAAYAWRARPEGHQP